MYDVETRWGVVPSKQRLFVEGQLLAQEADLEHLGKGAKILVKQGGRKKQGGSGKKGSTRRAAIDRSRKLAYKETKRIMAAWSGQNKDVSFCEYEQEMEEAANLNDPVGILAEGEYAKKLEKNRAKLHGTLKTNVKKDNSIQVMLLNMNGINMSKRFNHKADRLAVILSQLLP